MKAPKWFKKRYVKFGDWVGRNAEKLVIGGMATIASGAGGYGGYVGGTCSSPFPSEIAEIVGCTYEQAKDYRFWHYGLPGAIVGAILWPVAMVGGPLVGYWGIDKYREWKKEEEEEEEAKE